MQPINNRIAVITGAGSGIGRAVSIGLAEDGYRVCLLSRSQNELEETAQIINAKLHLSQEQQPLLFNLDVSQENSVNECIANIIERVEKIDLLFNNAGIFRTGTSELSLNDFNALLQVNLLGAFNLVHAIAPHMKKQKNGYIINLVSSAGKQGAAPIGGYAASKFGLIGFTESLCKELLPYGIKVTALCPSTVNTKMSKDSTWLAESERLSTDDVLETIRYLLRLSTAAIVPEILIECTRVIIERTKVD